MFLYVCVCVRACVCMCVVCVCVCAHACAYVCTCVFKYVVNITYIMHIKTHGSESQGQEEAAVRDN